MAHNHRGGGRGVGVADSDGDVEGAAGGDCSQAAVGRDMGGASADQGNPAHEAAAFIPVAAAKGSIDAQGQHIAVGGVARLAGGRGCREAQKAAVGQIQGHNKVCVAVEVPATGHGLDAAAIEPDAGDVEDAVKAQPGRAARLGPGLRQLEGLAVPAGRGARQIAVVGIGQRRGRTLAHKVVRRVDQPPGAVVKGRLCKGHNVWRRRQWAAAEAAQPVDELRGVVAARAVGGAHVAAVGHVLLPLARVVAGGHDHKHPAVGQVEVGAAGPLAVVIRVEREVVQVAAAHRR